MYTTSLHSTWWTMSIILCPHTEYIQNHLSVVKLYTKLLLKPDICLQGGTTLLMVATCKQRFEVLSVLLNYGANTNMQNYVSPQFFFLPLLMLKLE